MLTSAALDDVSDTEEKEEREREKERESLRERVYVCVNAHADAVTRLSPVGSE